MPIERWDWRESYGDPAQDKTNSKWGGFVPDVDKFDPLFFKLSPHAAEMMDPQHRLFLESVWKAIENAGYRASSFSGKAVGVFAGVQFNDYQQLLANQGEANAQASTGNSHAMLANRVSFLLNLRGPSESIDTACSSSLVAVHQAVNSIRRGESELAIAGGVSLMLSPETMISASQLGVLSPDGKCKTFDKSANGYVKGEGVAAILLKPLRAALADNDNIQAVIKGTAVNHGGKATSLTAPNSDAQAALLTTAYLEAGITADTVTYLELHGTGTELGDPVEVEGLKMAFKELASLQSIAIRQNHYCGLGSVKTNIGHLEPAAGIAGLLKVILAMQHQQLPGTLHLQTLNPYIKLKDTPFYVVEKTQAWNQLTDEKGHSIPRRAGVSSFGFGGANAHVVLEEYESPERSDIPSKIPQLVVLSAKNEERLSAYALEIRDFLTSEPATDLEQIQPDLLKVASDILKVSNLDIDLDEAFSEYGFDTVSLMELSRQLNDKYQAEITPAFLSEQVSLRTVAQYLSNKSQAHLKESTTTFERQANFSLADMAYTLQVGRENMEERLAMVVNNLEEVHNKLTQYAQGQTEINDFYRGNVKTSQTQSDLLVRGKAGEAFLKVVIEEKELSQLAQLWVSGVDIDWQLLYPNQKPQRISLPTYPFATERYWIPANDINVSGSGEKGHVAKLHPLLESNTSTFRSQNFTTKLTGKEFYLTDHVVGSQKTLPGVAYLEMARAAGELAGTQSVKRLTNIVWARPITVSDTPIPVNICLYPDQQQVEFEVSTINDNGERQVHAQGKLMYENQAIRDSDWIDIEAIQNRCIETWNGAKCYQFFQSTGFDYGIGFQTIQTLYRNNTETLSRLQLPTGLTGGFNDFVLHPSIMDGALQTVIGLMGDATLDTLYLPFALGEVELLGPLTEISYAYVRQANSSAAADSAVKKFNLSILDDSGQVLVRIENFSLRALKPQTEALVTMYYQSVWEPKVLENQTEPFTPTGTMLLFDTDDNRYSSFKERLKTEVILVTPGDEYQKWGPQTYSINPNHPADYNQLLEALTEQPRYIIHLWSQAPFVSSHAALNVHLEMSLYSCFHLCQALLTQKRLEPIQLLYIYLETPKALQPQYAAV
ncbi:MAG: beta-ketoacyl synthase N-terminal-like domain-containing protein, partial [Candidatus Parabeggiatoa sp.]|nr:beta-ketoacyl synthase N-terminal-like domain-containing protein [Candidatus Parabeggiatoa sp.]